MKLPIPQFGKKKTEQQYFLSLILRDEYISAWILEETSGKLRVAGKSEETLTTSIEQQTTDQWLEVLDRLISKAEETLPPKVMTHKTMFGVKDNWVEEEHIKKDYLSKLKKVCDALELQPVGFLVISEAIAHQIQEQEGAPLTALMVEIGKQQLSVSYIRTGKVVETKHSVIVGTPAATVDALLKFFTSASVLPSRIIIFDGGNTDQLAQEFIVHQWSKSLPFLHMPQITALPKGYDVKAVVLGAAEQMGLQVSGDVSLQEPLLSSAHTTPSSEETPNQAPTVSSTQSTLAQEFQQRLEDRLDENKPVPSEEHQIQDIQDDQVEGEPVTQIVSDNFGFVEGEDIATSLQAVDTPVSPASPVASTQHSYSEQAVNLAKSPQLDEFNTSSVSHSSPSHKTLSPLAMPVAFLLRFLTSSKTHLSRLFFHLPASGRIPRLLYVLPVILILIVASILYYILQVRASVELTLKPKIVEEQGTLHFTTKGANDFSTNTVSAQDASVDINGTTTTNATGSKDVGTPAKGTVTIYNNSNNNVSLSSGTILTSSNNLAFTLDKDASVASASGDVFSGTKPGTTDVSVTAKDIGTQYNLPSGTAFTMSGQPSSVAAKNGSAFSGGSKKTITVVSQKDIDKVISDLPSSLQDKALQQLQGKVAADQILLPGITSTDITNKQFDHKLNDQATSLTLKATVTFHSASYKNQDVQDLGKLLLKDKFTDNSSLSDKGITPTLSNIKSSSSGTIQADITLKAGLLPHIDKSQLLSQITGKSIDVAKNMLSNQPQVESSNISLHPNIPFVPQVLPRFADHITITIHSDE